MVLFTDHNAPYLFAISFVLLIGLLEILTLICGHMPSDVLDVRPDHYDSIAAGHINRALHYLNTGGLPALVVFCLLAGFFDLTDILLQYTRVMAWQSLLSDLSVVPINLLSMIIAVYYTGKVVAPWIPRDHSSATTEEEYIGNMALITGHQATSDDPCEGKFIGQLGQVHYLLPESEEEKFFAKGDKVLIICRLSATRYLAENDPWLQVS